MKILGVLRCLDHPCRLPLFTFCSGPNFMELRSLEKCGGEPLSAIEHWDFGWSSLSAKQKIFRLRKNHA